MGRRRISWPWLAGATVATALGGLLVTGPRAAVPGGNCDIPLPSGTPVILVTIDTLRQDHMGSDGYDRDTTPFLDRLASDGIRFTSCFAQSSWTLPSMLSLISSLQPPAFDVRDGIVPIDAQTASETKGGHQRAGGRVEVFSDKHLTLPEVFRDRGYRTIGISTSGILTKGLGWAQGFEVFHQEECLWKKADCALSLALSEVASAGDAPFFLWVHLFDPHFDTYGAPPVYEAEPGYRKLFETPAESPEAEQVIADYDRKIRYTDDQLRSFFDALDKRGVLDRALVVIAADHGEEFFEKGRWGHSKALTNTLVRVPLIFRLPERCAAGRVVGDVVGNIDVLPTVLDLLGVPVPPGPQGRSLRPAWEAGGNLPATPVYGETRRSGRDLRYLIDPALDRKLVLDRNAGTVSLYALSTDPAEENDLAENFPEQTADLKRRLLTLVESTRRRDVAGAKGTISERDAARLESLGYLER